MKEKIVIGISVQCPVGEEATMIFEELEVTDYYFENQRKN